MRGAFFCFVFLLVCFNSCPLTCLSRPHPPWASLRVNYSIKTWDPWLGGACHCPPRLPTVLSNFQVESPGDPSPRTVWGVGLSSHHSGCQVIPFPTGIWPQGWLEAQITCPQLATSGTFVCCSASVHPVMGGGPGRLSPPRPIIPDPLGLWPEGLAPASNLASNLVSASLSHAFCTCLSARLRPDISRASCPRADSSHSGCFRPRPLTSRGLVIPQTSSSSFFLDSCTPSLPVRSAPLPLPPLSSSLNWEGTVPTVFFFPLNNDGLQYDVIRQLCLSLKKIDTK